jgi:hypothetical protein
MWTIRAGLTLSVENFVAFFPKHILRLQASQRGSGTVRSRDATFGIQDQDWIRNGVKSEFPLVTRGAHFGLGALVFNSSPQRLNPVGKVVSEFGEQFHFGIIEGIQLGCVEGDCSNGVTIHLEWESNG